MAYPVSHWDAIIETFHYREIQMQIDFHHAVTYICARLAEFSPTDSEIVAHSAQYVDDATAEGEIWFENGMIFPRTASAHKMIDHNNMNELKNHRVWLPFHFLPGNNLEPPRGVVPTFDADEFMHRCICRPNSHPAQEMMRCVIERQDRPYALYRLGIATHVFMDTWAHQGFVGYQHKVNVSSDFDVPDQFKDPSLKDKVVGFFSDGFDKIKSAFVGATLPLGHGTALSYPDRPYLKWAYTNGLAERVVRNNPEDFLTAAQETYKHFCRYRDFPRLGPAVFGKTYSIPAKFDEISKQIVAINDEDGERRHDRWLELIENGTFGFSAPLSYSEKGDGSWKHDALGTVEDVAHLDDKTALPFPSGFATCHWKLFHDGLQAHRFYVLHELLPKYGLLSG